MKSIKTRVSELFGIKYPIIQGGMVWCSGWELVSAVSNAGGLGLIGSGSMNPEILSEHIYKVKHATSLPFGVNVPLISNYVEDIMDVIIREKIKIVFTSAGNPMRWTSILKEHGIIVAHVVANSKNAVKGESSGVDALVAEGFEAGGHNGREETSTFALIPIVRKKISIPLIAAGGIGTGSGILAALSLGAEGVQIGSLFAASTESSAHKNFKKKIIESNEGDTELTMKQLIPVRLLKNEFYQMVKNAIEKGAGKPELIEILGKGRARMGMFEGNLEEGELEIGQVSSLIDEELSVHEIFKKLDKEFREAKRELLNLI